MTRAHLRAAPFCVHCVPSLDARRANALDGALAKKLDQLNGPKAPAAPAQDSAKL